MARLPPELITDILSHLPVKTLLQFRSVSKPWCSLIDNPRFITLHLNKSLHTKSNRSLIIESRELSSLDFDDFDPIQNLIRTPHPFLPSFAAVLNSCNGLLLLQGVDLRITLFNPSTRKHFNIPSCGFRRPHPRPDRHLEGYIVFGLGFDPVADDYKVIGVLEFKDEDNNWVGSESRVYSLKSNSWKKIKAFPYSVPSGQQWGVPLDGGFHTVVKKYHDSDWPKLLVSIDFATDDYKILPLPKIPEEKFVGLGLERLGNCLCLNVHTKTQDLQFWVMKEYGVGESWTKLLSTPAPMVDEPIVHMHILAYSKCEKKDLFACNNMKFVWFDLKRRTFAKIRVRGLPSPFYACVCVNSLVRLNANEKITCDEEREQKTKEKKTRKQRDDFLSKGFKLKL